eukprot:m51a1_g7330 putative mitochondrial rho gtpase 1-like (729) ;mRNA; r:173670-176412
MKPGSQQRQLRPVTPTRSVGSSMPQKRPTTRGSSPQRSPSPSTLANAAAALQNALPSRDGNSPQITIEDLVQMQEEQDRAKKKAVDRPDPGQPVDRMTPIVERFRFINVVVIGDKKTGKSKLISALMDKPFGDLVPTVMPINKVAPGIRVIDTSCRANDRDDLIAKVTSSHALILCYAADQPESLLRIRSFWMPFVRTLLGQRLRPVVLACTRNDLRKDTADENIVAALLQDYEEFETFLPTSASTRQNVTAAFFYAAQAVMFRFTNAVANSLEKKNAEAMKKVVEHQKWEIATRETTIGDLVANRERLQKLTENADKAASEAARSAEIREKQLKTDHEREMVDYKAARDKEFAEAAAAAEKRVTELEKKLNTEWSAKLEDMKQKFTKQIRAAGEDQQKRLIQLTIEKDNVIKGLEEQLSKGRAQIDQLTRDLEDARRSMDRVEEQGRVTSLRAMQKFRRELQEEKEQHEMEKETIRVNTEKRLMEEQREHKTQLEKEAMSMIQAKEADRSMRDLMALRESADKVLAAEKKTEALAAQVKELQSAAERRQVEYERLIEIRTQAESKYDALKSKHEEAMKNAKIELANAVKECESQITVTLQREMEQLVRQHETEMEDFRESFLREKEGLLREIEVVRAKLAKRSGGDDDGSGLTPRAAQQLQSRAQAAEERVTKLEGDVREKDLELMACREELRFYKMELHNREVNYSKIYGTQPRTGASQNNLVEKK